MPAGEDLPVLGHLLATEEFRAQRWLAAGEDAERPGRRVIASRNESSGSRMVFRLISMRKLAYLSPHCEV